MEILWKELLWGVVHRPAAPQNTPNLFVFTVSQGSAPVTDPQESWAVRVLLILPVENWFREIWVGPLGHKAERARMGSDPGLLSCRSGFLVPLSASFIAVCSFSSGKIHS